MIDLYAREYARLESERAELNCDKQSENEALKRLKGFQRRCEMQDVIFIALVLVFFGIAFWYVRFCDRV